MYVAMAEETVAPRDNPEPAYGAMTHESAGIGVGCC